MEGVSRTSNVFTWEDDEDDIHFREEFFQIWNMVVLKHTKK